MMVDHFVHSLAWLAIKTLPLHTAQKVVARAVAPMTPLTVDEGVELSRRLRGGTCLSRSLVVAARVPGARVAIGGQRKGRQFAAHAWVEVKNQPLAGQSIGEQTLAHI
jgi:hypothetical protein